MRIINPDLLASFRRQTRCEYCGLSCPGSDPAHIYSRGAGRLDISINLIGLCRECHSDHHNGKEPSRIDMLAIVATREKCLQDDIESVIWLFRRLDKVVRFHQAGEYIEFAMGGMTISARDLAKKVFREIPCSKS